MPDPRDGEVVCNGPDRTPLNRSDLSCWRCGTVKLTVVREWRETLADYYTGPQTLVNHGGPVSEMGFVPASAFCFNLPGHSLVACNNCGHRHFCENQMHARASGMGYTACGTCACANHLMRPIRP